MSFKKCPKCDINHIAEEEDICTLCKRDSIPDFSRIKQGYIYGSNSREIYEKFCNTLGWNKRRAASFGYQQPLYASNVDCYGNGVWFIFYPNYDLNKLDTIVKSYHVINLILDNGDTILEAVDDYWGDNKSWQ